jgi:hypothetical protein
MPRKLHLAVAVYGVGGPGQHGLWKDPRVPNLRFRTIEDLERFAADVVPLLQKRGLFRTEYEGDTLRESLGLPFPANRHTLKGAVR